MLCISAWRACSNLRPAAGTAHAGKPRQRHRSWRVSWYIYPLPAAAMRGISRCLSLSVLAAGCPGGPQSMFEFPATNEKTANKILEHIKKSDTDSMCRQAVVR